MTDATAGPSGPAVADAAGGRRLLHGFAVVLAIWTFGLLSVGGVVTSREAGLAVPDWPLSYGHVNPPNWTSTPNVFEEHFHRLLGWVAGLLVIATAVGIQRLDPRPWMRRLGWIVLAAIVVQGVIGGYFRVVLLQHRMAVVHGVTGQAFFCLVVAVALFLSRGWAEAPPPAADAGARRLRRLSLLAAAAVFLQVVLGALVRHSRVGHSMEHVWPHAAGAIVVAILALACMFDALSRHGPRPAIVRPAAFLGCGVVAQVLLGLGAWQANRAGFEEMTRPAFQVATTSVHQAAGALVLASAVVLHLRVRRLLRDPALGEAVSPAPAAALPAGGAA